METFAIFSAFVDRIQKNHKDEKLDQLNDIAENWTFATRDPVIIAEKPEFKSINVLNNIDHFEKKLPGFRGHYDKLSEFCHPNWSGHTFLFA